jgi:magnesium-transporting ATPase (P-type)
LTLDPTSTEKDAAWYLRLDASNASDTAQRFFTFMLLISNLIPLSLYVSMRITRTAQKFFMDFDQDCVYVNEEEQRKTEGESGRYPLNVRTMDLNDELGQITHLFTDKTGTLTSNYMEFRKFSVNGACRCVARRDHCSAQLYPIPPLPFLYLFSCRRRVRPWNDADRHGSPTALGRGCSRHSSPYGQP